ncbi:patatin-like phospholipase family protein [Maridesulfovibrio salexigens]|uniref:Patatin n=1 Tax=Maridesulfovibrio salexigens (strain ATCC 14822 / DSM 2638 / NCIMB 8403 / VKM B-1763) TaxID=526222 RepID=C6BYT2_MARSD|nr:patatin-like phospholipase family protein [Maridesulfovibrio salexigens]ACS80689.1 Patatin [Maridesulfovibrio salexigens DSM 2638]
MEKNSSPESATPENTTEEQSKGPKTPERPSVALIIGSEGIKSFCALPFIEYLQAEKINLDLVIGVSGGALLAGFMGAGYDLKQIQEVFSKTVDPRFYTDVDYNSVLEIASTGMGKFTAESGILKTDCLRRTYETLFKKTDISDLSPKTLIATTDLETGKPVILEEGNLAQAIYASSAIYPLMPPGNVDGRRLIDGAFSSPVPIMECVKRQIDIIIAIYFDDACNPEPDSFVSSYFNTSRIFKRSILTSQLPLSIDMHHHEIIPVYIKHPRPIELWEVKKLTEIVHAGKVAFTNKKTDFKEAVSEFKIKRKQREAERKEKEAELRLEQERAAAEEKRHEEALERMKQGTSVEEQPEHPEAEAPPKKRTFKIVKTRKDRRGSGI